MKTITITEQQWRELNVGLLYNMANYLHTQYSEDQTREERIEERNDLNNSLREYKKIKEAFKS